MTNDYPDTCQTCHTSSIHVSHLQYPDLFITIWYSLYKSFAALKNERVMAKGELWIEYPFAVNSKIIQNIYIIQRSLPSKGILCIPR